MFDNREQKIIDFVKNARECSSKEIFEAVDISVSYATLKRILTKLISDNYLAIKGKGKGIWHHQTQEKQKRQPAIHRKRRR